MWSGRMRWLLAAGILAGSWGGAAAMKPPSVPLVSVDPFFSVWSPADRLTDAETVHWTGAKQPVSVVLEADGRRWRLCGASPADVPALPQRSLEVRPTQSVYTFGEGELAVELRFSTAKLADDLEVFSRPVAYVTAKVKGAKAWRLDASISSALATNDDRAPMATNRCTVAGLPAVSIGRKVQKPLAFSGDCVRCDWGWAWLVGPSAPAAGESHFILAYDDVESIQFFGENLPAWWRRKGRKFADMLAAAEAERASVLARLDAFDAELRADLERIGGPVYADLACLAYRQSFAACKLVADRNGQPLYFSKENNSNGCIGTVDVLYPQCPHLLLLSPTLVRATLAPVLLYASHPRWPWPFSPHDLGRYPLANGQRYGGGEKAKSEASLMPVEECGNMIIALAALAEIEGNAGFASDWWPVVTKWAQYLERFGFDPGNQLCTDDFAGHLAHNANLAVKSIVALAAYGRLARLRGDSAVADRYARLAKEMVPKWMEAAKGGKGGGYRLAYDRPDTWSMKYNLVWDRILGLGLFPASVADAEMKAYRALGNPFGLPLDNRRDWTKADWLVWCATLTGRRDDFDALVAPLYRFVNETSDREPFSDWYWTKTAKHQHFRARSVIGGVFLPALYDRALWRKYAGRDRNRTQAYAPIGPAPAKPAKRAESARTAPAEKSGPDLAGRIYLGSTPSLGGDGSRFVFEWNDAIWIAPVAGGTATQLTSEHSDGYPQMSPDGTRVAFTSDRDSGNKAFEIDLSTSGIRQLSHHSESTLVRAWCPDGSNLLCRVFRDHAEPRRSSRIAVVPTARRAAERVLFDVSADDPSMSPDGTRVLFTYRGDNVYRKRPNSFTSEAGEIWMYDLGSGEFTAMVTDRADSRNPLWAPDGKGFYYLNAAGGARNVYYQSLGQGPAGRPAPAKLTDFRDDHVFQPTVSPDGRTMVFRQAFDFWRLRLGEKGAKPERIDLRAPVGYVPRQQTRRRWLTSCWNLDESGDVTFCDNGMQIAMTVGGDLFVMDTVMREPRCVRPSPLTKERDCVFSRDGRALYFLSDRGDGTDLWKAERTEADKPWWRNRAFRFTRLTYDDEFRENLKLSPDGGTFAWQTCTGRLVFADTNGHVRARGPKVAEGGSYAFSPDGKFVASQYLTRDHQYDVAVVSATEDEKSWILTRNFGHDGNPAWSPDGKVIAFTSVRPEIAGGNLVCYVYLDAALEEREAKEARRIRSADDTVRDNSASSGAKKEEKKEEKKAADEKRPVPFEELADRVRVTRVTGSGLFFNPDGRTLLFNSGSEAKAIRIPDKLDPWRVCGKTGTVVDWIKKDRTERVLRVVNSLPAHGETTFGFSAYLENTDIADYQELVFRTAWGRIRDRFYDPNFHGRDWPAVRAKYLPYARNAGSMSVFTRVVCMMLGELDASHLWYFQTDSSRSEWTPRANAPHWNAETAHLGIRFDPAHRGAGWKIRDVVRGSPADRVELGFKPGDLVTAVNGEKVDSDTDPTLVLNGPGKGLVTVTVNGRDHEIRATSYGEIRKLLETETFRARREFTHAKSKGRFGYLNIRDMDAESLGKFKYEVYNEGYGREGLLIDVRDNHGGYTADQILMTLFGAQHSFAVTREGGPGYLAGYWTRPVWYRPIVVLCNEDSGSNAEIFSHAIHQLGRGKLVGRPTGGDVIAVSKRRLLDFGEFWDAHIGFFLLDGTDMEHHGAPVDFHVDDVPPDVNRGVDRQLEKAIEVLGAEVEDWKRKNPPPRMKYVNINSKI